MVSLSQHESNNHLSVKMVNLKIEVNLSSKTTLFAVRPVLVNPQTFTPLLINATPRKEYSLPVGPHPSGANSHLQPKDFRRPPSAIKGA
jgi:hypothetical protein